MWMLAVSKCFGATVDRLHVLKNRASFADPALLNAFATIRATITPIYQACKILWRITIARNRRRNMDEPLRKAALEYHRLPTPGKISVTPTKGLINQRDLALAYSPGVAYACLAIREDPNEAADLTSRSNLVGVVTNGTAVLGLGNIGPLAAKPVMEGKGCLFKKFAGIDVFDIELAELDPDKLIEHVAALEPTLGGINLEDIKAPECFYVEKKLRDTLNIPVFHDDQHGTAIISAAALLNGMKIVGKQLGNIKLVCSGAGAAAIACLDVFVGLGVKRQNIYVTDSKGVIYEGREAKMEPNKARYAQKTKARTLGDIIEGADAFLGCSTAGVLTKDMVKRMADKPLILALANPDPEITPADAKAARPDCIIATGRSDYPNQVNNVLCFPFIFRGALDVGATKFTDEMKLACVHAIADLAQAELSDVVAMAYGGQDLSFGPDYIIPTPFDPRLILKIAPAVAKAAMESGVATRPILDLDGYRQKLNAFVYHSGTIMAPVFAAATLSPKRVVYAEGEEERVLRAVQVAVDEGLAQPILIGRPEVIETRVQRFGLRLSAGKDYEVVNPEHDPRYREVWIEYHKAMGRFGVTPDVAKEHVRQYPALIGAMLIRRGEADAMLCGVVGRYTDHLRRISNVLVRGAEEKTFAAMNGLLLPKGTVFICDTYVNENPTPEQLADITVMAAEALKRFGLTPKIALLSHSNFGSSDSISARKMARATQLLAERAPELEVEGEMHGDAALSEEIRLRAMPESRLKGQANLLVMPSLDAANIAFNLLKVTGGEGITLGPILLGATRGVHIMTPSATVRRLVNMTALAVVEAGERRHDSASENLKRESVTPAEPAQEPSGNDLYAPPGPRAGPRWAGLRTSLACRCGAAQRRAQSTFAPEAFTTFAHFGDLGLNVRGELGGRVADRLRALARELFLHIRRRERLYDRFVQLRNHVLRSTGGREHAEPRAGLVTGKPGLGDRRYIRHGGRAFGARHGDPTQLARLHMRQSRRHVVEHHLHLSSEEIGHRRRASFVRDVHHVDASHRLEELAREVNRRAIPARGEGKLARLRLGKIDDLLDRFRRHRRMHDQEVRHRRDQRHRREVLDCVVGHLRI